MSSVNKVILVGNVGKDPEIRNLESGLSLANFSLATSENWVDKNTGEKKSQAEWHNLSFAGKVVDSVISKYVKKGDKIYIEGKLRTRKWKDKEGNDRYTTDINCNNITLLGGNNNSSEPYVKPQQQSNSQPQTDDLPF